MNTLLPALACVLALAAPAMAQVRVSTPLRPAVRVTQVRTVPVRVATARISPTVRTVVSRPAALTVNARVRAVRVAPVVPRPAPAPAPTGTGSLRCAATENGSPVSATLTVRSNGQTIYSGSCNGFARTVSAGTYDATIRLSGLVDSPERFQRIRVLNGATESFSTNFETGRLTVDVMHEGRRIPGRATILRNGAVVGTIGSGVYSHISAGTYTVRVEVAAGFAATSGSREYAVEVTSGSARRIRANF